MTLTFEDWSVDDGDVGTAGDFTSTTDINASGHQTLHSSAITSLDTAIMAYAEQAKYGAYLSRLQYASDNLRM